MPTIMLGKLLGREGAVNKAAASSATGMHWYDLKISGSKGQVCSLE